MFKWLFHKKELLTTFDGNVYYDAMRKLAEAKIPFKNDSHNMNASGGRMRGRMGSFGEGLSRSTQYYIYVLDKDLDEAEYVINQRNF